MITLTEFTTRSRVLEAREESPRNYGNPIEVEYRCYLPLITFRAKSASVIIRTHRAEFINFISPAR